MQSTRSVELAESGMEDALWALNRDDWSGWTLSGNTATKISGGFSFDGGVTGSITVKVVGYDGSLPKRTVTATGTTTQTDGTTQTRTLTSTSERASLLTNAVAATTSRVRFRSAGIVDSYDSTLGDYSTQTPGFSAVISSGSTTTSSATVQLTNAQIKGYVATLSTGPSFSTSARLLGPSTPATTKIDTSRISTSPYQATFDEVVPTGAGDILPSGTATIGTAGATAAPSLHITLRSVIFTIKSSFFPDDFGMPSRSSGRWGYLQDAPWAQAPRSASRQGASAPQALHSSRKRFLSPQPHIQPVP
jgi:hypothetical protein